MGCSPKQYPPPYGWHEAHQGPVVKPCQRAHSRSRWSQTTRPNIEGGRPACNSSISLCYTCVVVLQSRLTTFSCLRGTNMETNTHQDSREQTSKRVAYSYRFKKEDQPAYQTTHLFSTIKYNNECNEIISVPSHDTIPGPPLRLIPFTSAALHPNLSCSHN